MFPTVDLTPNSIFFNVGEVKSSARVTVKGAPQVKRPFRSAEVKEGEKILLECTITGFPDPECVWTKNGNAIDDPRVKTKAEKVIRVKPI